MRMRGMLVGLGLLAGALFTSCFANGYCKTDEDCTPGLQYCDPEGNVCRDETGFALFEPEDYSASSSSSSSSSGGSSSSSGGSCAGGGLTLDQACRLSGSDSFGLGDCRTADANLAGLATGNAICGLTPTGRRFFSVRAQAAGTLSLSAQAIPTTAGTAQVAIQRFGGGAGCDTSEACSTAGETTSMDVSVSSGQEVRFVAVVNTSTAATAATLTVSVHLH